MAKTRNIVTEWGQAANTSNSGYGAGANNTIGWGSVHANSNGHDRTDLVGVPSVYVGNSETVDGSGDPTGGTAQLFYRNRIEARPLWNTRQNLLTYSEDFSNADWGRAGTLSLDSETIRILATTSEHTVFWNGTALSAGTYTHSVEIENKTGSRYVQIATNGATGTNWAGVIFDLQTGTFTDEQESGSYTILSYSSEDLGSGKYRIYLSTTNSSDTCRGLRVRFSNSGTPSYSGFGSIVFTGNGTDELYVRKAQFNEGSTADEYVKTEANPYSFKGDETQLNDFSASNNGGQIYSGGALSFDGVNDVVVVGNDLNPEAITVIANVTTDGTKSGVIASKYDFGANKRQWQIQGNGSPLGAINISVSEDGGLTNFKGWVTNDTILATAGSYEICMTFENDTLRLFVNGEEITDFNKVTDGTVNNLYSSDADLLLGARLNNTVQSDFSDFQNNETKIYSRALTAAEVLQNYNNPQQPITDGLEVWYDFNELNGGTLFDRSGNGNNATINGATWVSGVKEGFQPAQSGFNNYQTFDGTDDEVELNNEASIGVGSAFTLKGVFSASQVSSDASIFENINAADDRILVGVKNDKFVVSSFDGITNTKIEGDIEAGSKYEFNLSFDGSNGVSGTINGVALTTSSEGFTGAGTVQMTIGARGNASLYFQGIIDYVEVEGVGRWSNLGGWVDEIGSNDGTVNGSPSSARIFGQTYSATTDVFSNTIQNAYIANALNFSGGYSGLYVDAGANVDTSGAFSFAGWVYLVSTESNQNIIGNRIAGAGIQVYADHNTTDFDFKIVNDDGTTTTVTDSDANDYGVWIFVSATRASDGSINFYVGNKTTTPSISGTANQSGGTPTAGSENMIFAQRNDNIIPLNGYLIYPLMYTEDLSTANTDLAPIEQIWNATKSLIPS